jgi:hypothetical protein
MITSQMLATMLNIPHFERSGETARSNIGAGVLSDCSDTRVIPFKRLFPLSGWSICHVK